MFWRSYVESKWTGSGVAAQQTNWQSSRTHYVPTAGVRCSIETVDLIRFVKILVRNGLNATRFLDKEVFSLLAVSLLNYDVHKHMELHSRQRCGSCNILIVVKIIIEWMLYFPPVLLPSFLPFFLPCLPLPLPLFLTPLTHAPHLHPSSSPPLFPLPWYIP